MRSDAGMAVWRGVGDGWWVIDGVADAGVAAVPPVPVSVDLPACGVQCGRGCVVENLGRDGRCGVASVGILEVQWMDAGGINRQLSAERWPEPLYSPRGPSISRN